MKRLYYILSILLFAVTVRAQISGGGSPKALGAYDFFTKLDVDTVYHPADSTEKRYVAGNVCAVDMTPQNSGFISTDNGYRVWRAGITSPGAEAISIVFTEFNIPDGAKLFLYNPSQSNIIGSFSSVNNNDNNILPVQPIAADTVIVEYQEPLTSGSEFKGKLRIGYASHNFITTNGYLKKTNPEGGIKCCQDAYVADSDNPVINAVCLIYTTDTDSKNSYYGSGTLINNPDAKPYVISSYHVFKGDCAPTSVFFFQNHKMVTDLKGSAELSIAGSKCVTQAEDIDMALVELNQMPPKDYRPYFAGWDANEDAGYMSPYKCFHHPFGDFTKLSTATATAVKSKTNFDTSTFPYKTFWEITRWASGATQGGSSGSALLNSEGKIIGCLTGGSSSCDSPVKDFFWQMSAGWDFHVDSQMRLENWLDPHNTGIKSMDGADPYAALSPCRRVSNIVEDDNIDAQRLNGEASGYQAGHNSLGCTGYAEEFAFDVDQALYGVYVGTYKGTYKAAHPVYVKILSGTDASVIATEEFRPLDYGYKYDGTLITSVNSKWAKRDSYIRFSQPVNVGTKCYVAVTFENYENPDTLAIYQTTNRLSGNSAYYYLNSSWDAFTSYPSNPQPASLWICPVVADSVSSSADETMDDASQEREFTVLPDADEAVIRLFSKSNDAVTWYAIVDLGGRELQSGLVTLSDGMASIEFHAPEGLYIVELRSASTLESSKFLWR